MKKTRIAKNNSEYLARRIFSYVVLAAIILAVFVISSAVCWLGMFCLCSIAKALPTVGMIIIACTLGLIITVCAALGFADII